MKDFKSILYVAIGACSYGVLATIVKYANDLGIKTSALTFLQFFVGFLFLFLLNLLKKNSETTEKIKTSSKIKLIIWGTALGLTTTLYYLSIQYIPVSLGIILLMQSIWISLIIEIFVTKTKPSFMKIISVMIALIGTFLATDIFNQAVTLDFRGILLGFSAGVSYSIAIFVSSNIESQIKSSVRSQYLVLGGLILITLFWNFNIIRDISIEALPWGILIAVFGTILPPLLFTKGIPKTGIALANIIASLEIPVSILSAIIILNESVNLIQWIGVAIILFAVVTINKNLGI
ncbi:DMT family transporter [Chryseobacterium zhengzhouense]|uniref:DMT family transporter n=1 Tax=Chryseobacterium zhengzhouense TaxID=1636086 RepID=A0ABW2M1P0_9FLAO